MSSWRNYHRIAHVLGTILRTIDCVYLQHPGGNPPLAELKASHIEQWRIFYPMTSVACAFSTARHVGSRVTWLHSCNNLRTTQFAPRCTRSSGKNGIWRKSNLWHRKLSWPPILTLLSRLPIQEVSGSYSRWRLGRFVFINQQNAGSESTLSNSTSWTKK